MTPTEAMLEARTVEEMAEAFHPTAVIGALSHTDPVLDAIEAALLWGAKRIGREDFLAALEDLDA